MAFSCRGKASTASSTAPRRALLHSPASRPRPTTCSGSSAYSGEIYVTRLRFKLGGRPVLSRFFYTIDILRSRYNFLYVLCAGGAPDPASMGSHSPVRKRVFFSHLYIQMHHFTKTGSGQTYLIHSRGKFYQDRLGTNIGKALKKRRVSLGGLQAARAFLRHLGRGTERGPLVVADRCNFFLSVPVFQPFLSRFF
eukprot:COSAG06_NODE_4034_length_4639_cov_77.635711_3_plen_195_part_00